MVSKAGWIAILSTVVALAIWLALRTDSLNGPAARADEIQAGVTRLSSLQAGASELGQHIDVVQAGSARPDAAELARLRERLANLEHKLGAPVGPGSEETRRPTSEQIKAANIDQHRSLIAAVQQEPRDAGWARAAEASVAEDLRSAALARPQGAQARSVRQVECHTDSCLVTIEWPNYAAAAREWEEVLTTGTSLPCSREILLEDPVSASAPYSTQLILSDCK